MSMRRIFHASESPCVQIGCVELCLRPNVHASESTYVEIGCVEMSMRPNVHASKCPCVGMLLRRNGMRRNVMSPSPTGGWSCTSDIYIVCLEVYPAPLS